ncbi:hypothetical protein EPUS_02867 [Endocarpon pusillum Z07020]|uniref:Sodium/calcium exchanger membrane region domain-containing protein n=1 Tax=Endocarpon pusillum (strain Z07020 / HMAS-L-300199) TaxID=1263415 RepID=U1HQ95_ENDPU|nr:uncharacterized protein EPUS_02867 [Endocarpon pusillum Z07020]ERF72585.1 hypothetical protein EPUS_02867 [Endocarpon pusillum Z07020]
MNDSDSTDPSLSTRIRSWFRTKPHVSPTPPPSDPASTSTLNHSSIQGEHGFTESTTTAVPGSQIIEEGKDGQPTSQSTLADDRSPGLPPPAPPPTSEKAEGEVSPTSSAVSSKEKLPMRKRFYNDCKRIIFCSWINWLLIFVPVGIIVGVVERAQGESSAISPTVVFAMNAIAIIPLASLLAFATESVATKMGDTIGALLNVTFGNAVELIVFIIALVANEIQIVQAAALGSILSNLLLILGMCFLFGGLRFREQLYNPAVSQMSACLLSLSVVSLLLPTAFHASFSNSDIADRVVLKVLLCVYVLYLLFQLKSHAYMYESTPQHLIDEESHPGVLAEMLNASSSSDDSSSSSDIDSDGSSGSHTTAKRIKRALRRKRRKSSVSSRDAPSVPSTYHVSSPLSNVFENVTPGTRSPQQLSPKPSHSFEAVMSGDEGDIDRESRRARRTSTGINSRDFGIDQNNSVEEVIEKVRKHKKKFRKSKKSKPQAKAHEVTEEKTLDEKSTQGAQAKDKMPAQASASLPQVAFVNEVQDMPDTSLKRPFHFRDLSRAAIPRALSPAIFSQSSTSQTPSAPGLLGLPKAGPNIRRTTSMPEMGHTTPSPIIAPLSVQPLPHLMPSNQQITVIIDPEDSHGQQQLSRTSAVLLLLVATALVAVCAELLVNSIDYLVQETGVSQAFIGLIILPIVGNAAEHVTAVTVASKNKMDLAIGVALGSSIQIAIFVTPLIVLLGWCLQRDMSLYFSLFETISLFASAFIVNYLMIDGRSNYLEGALLIAAYVIIAVAAFFYPSCENLSEAGGLAEGACR